MAAKPRFFRGMVSKSSDAGMDNWAMPKSNCKIELLAPARDAAIGIEAINHGADAVYIGGPSFGARRAADNNVQDIEVLVGHAHRFNARIFVTVNTILRDDELESARALIWQLYNAGADALIIQDMGLLELDLPPIQLHASTQTDIRTVAKARFLQDVGLSQLVLARELTLQEIAEIRAGTSCTLEFFIHGALCVAYSGQCYISEAQTGRSANRGDCSQACRLPYQVIDSQGRFVAHDRHVLSMKDNNQSANLAALIQAGIRSFKIEGRYKDMGYVKNITAHYRKLIDNILESQPVDGTALRRASSGRTKFFFEPDPRQNFNREFTDYFVQGRQADIGAFDSPKNPGQPVGFVLQTGPNWVEIETLQADTTLHNGDGLCYFDLQKELSGLAVNRALCVNRRARHWRIFPKDPMSMLKDLRKGTEINRNRDSQWVKQLDRKSSERRIGIHLVLEGTDSTLALTATDEDGNYASASVQLAFERSRGTADASVQWEEQLRRLGDTLFEVRDLRMAVPRDRFLPLSMINALRREAIDGIMKARGLALQPLPRAKPAETASPYPQESLTYLANVFNRKARDFYARHGVRLIEPAYEAGAERDEVSLMITRHCVRYALSLCPKQAKGVTGVQGTVKAEPLKLVHGRDELTLRFDCKSCEMHVIGKRKGPLSGQNAGPARQRQSEVRLQFFKKRPVSDYEH
jgi:putative protease